MTTQTVRQIEYRLRIMWDFASWSDISEHFQSASGMWTCAAPGSTLLSGRGQIPNMRLILDNSEGQFSAFNSNSPYYIYLQGGRVYHTPIEFSVRIFPSSTWEPVFTGIMKMPVETTPVYGTPGSVSVDCRGHEELIAQVRLSTPLTTFQNNYGNQMESDFIYQWLVAAGVSPTDMEIDAGLCRIDAAWLDQESPLEDCWNLAAACGGWFFSLPNGKFAYRSATYPLLQIVPASAFHDGDYDQFTPRYDEEDLFSEVTIETSPRRPGDFTVLWEPDETPVIPANSSIELIAHFRYPVKEIVGIEYTPITTGGGNLSGFVSITQTQYAQRLVMEITNSHTIYSAILRNMKVGGQGIEGDPSRDITATSTALYWEPTHNRRRRSRRVSGNIYIQSTHQAHMLVKMLLEWHEVPRGKYTLSGVQGDPSLRLLDRITISNPRTMPSARDAIVTSIQWNASMSGFTQQVQAIDAEDFYPYADATDQYFWLGTNTLGTGSSDPGRFFY